MHSAQGISKGFLEEMLCWDLKEEQVKKPDELFSNRALHTAWRRGRKTKGQRGRGAGQEEERNQRGKAWV